MKHDTKYSKCQYIVWLALALWLTYATTPVVQAADETVTYGLLQDATNPLKFTAVLYPDTTGTFTSPLGNAFTYLLPPGSVVTNFTNINGTWLNQDIGVVSDTVAPAAEFLDRQVYQPVETVGLNNIETTAGQPVALFSFELVADCTSGSVGMMTNDSALQEHIFLNGAPGAPPFTNVNHAFYATFALGAEAAVDMYTGNNSASRSYNCPVSVADTSSVAIGAIRNTTGASADVVYLGETVSFTIHMTNTGNVIIPTLPLTNTYQTTFLEFVSATPAPDLDASNDGVLRWSNVAPIDGLGLGQTVEVIVNFTAMADTTLQPSNATMNQAITLNGQETQAFVQIVPDEVHNGVRLFLPLIRR